MNPFLSVSERHNWGPGSLEMALPLIEALGIRSGMRVLEVGAGSGQIASILAKQWDVSVVTLEPWHGGQGVQSFAAREGVWDRVLALKLYAQDMPFADATFDAVLSIGSFEMIGDDRPKALAEMVRVARVGAAVGIAEPMCLPGDMPPELRALDQAHTLQVEHYFRTVDWNRDLFERSDLEVTEAHYFPDAYRWWVENLAQYNPPDGEEELIRRDGGRWLSLGMVVGRKAGEGARAGHGTPAGPNE